MAWQRWNPESRTVFRRVTIEDNREDWREKTDAEKNLIRGMFDYGFVRKNISSAVRIVARDEFFKLMEIDPVDFDWQAWRQYQGYDEDFD